ncbi:MAG: hypothetical protein ACT4PY_12505, partial [Armatimonadota bacterium]
NSRAIIDATRPFEWRHQFPMVAESSPERRAEVLKKWGHIILADGADPTRISASAPALAGSKRNAGRS